MIETALTVGFAAVLTSMLLSTWRLVRGPRTPDRVLALDTLYVNHVALVVLIGLWLENDVFFESALLIAMMGFVGTVSLAKYVSGRNVIE
jgi:multicomponent K+:H+ antiporter subunit F